jgi:hypothetical protein
MWMIIHGALADQKLPHSSLLIDSVWTDCICAAPGESHVKAVTALRLLNDMGRKDDSLVKIKPCELPDRANNQGRGMYNLFTSPPF